MTPLATLEPPTNSGFSVRGSIVGTSGCLLLAEMPPVGLHTFATVTTLSGRTIRCEIVGFHDALIKLSPFDDPHGVCVGDPVCGTESPLEVQVPLSKELQIVSAFGESMSDTSSLASSVIAARRAAPLPCDRITTYAPFITGVDAIDMFTPLVEGQRIVVRAPAGVGKSTLITLVVERAQYDHCVVGLIGERGREAAEFCERVRTISARHQMSLVVSTSDEPPVRRSLAALTASAIAEYHRDNGKKVLLIIDSLTRWARAVRDVGLSLGEIPVRQGFPARVFTELPHLLERAGKVGAGSITACYTVLSHGDDEEDTLSDEITSIVDGHVTLSQRLFHSGYRPAIDITRSLSRLEGTVHDPETRTLTHLARKLLARLYKERELLLFGGHPDRELQAALALERELITLLADSPGDHLTITGVYSSKIDAIRELLRSTAQVLCETTSKCN